MTKRRMFLVIFAVCPIAVRTLADDKSCTCAGVRKSGEGWCRKCESGAMYGVAIKSHKLYEALQGSPVADVSSIRCLECRKAAKSKGTCERCHLNFYEGKMYKSAIARALAEGRSFDAAKSKCCLCRDNSRKGVVAFCANCDAGPIGGRLYHGEAVFKKAEAALGILKAAAMTKCEGCAIAMITDGKCDHCKVEFKGGKPTKTD